jgi:uncharacterized integral membrane protein
MLIARLFAAACYIMAAILVLAFIFSNREAVQISLFPLGATAEMPLYLALCMVFVLGLSLGLIYSFVLWFSLRGRIRRAERAADQLEKEVEAQRAAAQKSAV